MLSGKLLFHTLGSLTRVSKSKKAGAVSLSCYPECPEPGLVQDGGAWAFAVDFRQEQLLSLSASSSVRLQDYNETVYMKLLSTVPVNRTSFGLCRHPQEYLTLVNCYC